MGQILYKSKEIKLICLDDFYNQSERDNSFCLSGNSDCILYKICRNNQTWSQEHPWWNNKVTVTLVQSVLERASMC